MKLLAILILTTLSLSNSICFDKFEIITATSQKWKDKQKSTGYGTYYEITIVPKVNSEELRFDKLWIGDKYFQVSCYQKGKRVKNDTFGAGDTITIRVNDEIVPKSMPFVKKEDYKNENTLPPKEYKGEALLSYLFKGKRKYIKIDKFTVIEPVSYP